MNHLKPIILSGGPGDGQELDIPDGYGVFYWFMAHGRVEYRPIIVDGLTLPVWAPGPLIPNIHYNADEPF